MNAKPFDIVGATVFDSLSGTWVQRDLFVRDGEIASNADHGATRLDLSGSWIVPGLIDSHVHICCEADPDAASTYHFDEDERSALSRGKQNLSRCLEHGVTTVRDTGSRSNRALQLRDPNSRCSEPGPRVYACGEFLAGPGDPGHNWCTPIPPRRLKQAVDDMARQGVDFIKIINDPVSFDLKTLREAVRTAHDLGLPVACHAYTPGAAEIAVDAGVDSIEHASGWSPNLAEKIQKEKVSIVPTAVAALDVVSRPVAALSAGLGESDLEIFDSWWTDLRLHLPASISRGLVIGVGTDAGLPPTQFGESLWREMEILLSFGLSWADCLRAATHINAKVLGDSKLGHLGVGAYADFVVFGLDPVQSRFDARDHIRSVFINGLEVVGDLMGNQVS